MRIVCVIPARGGSKGLPGKNLRTVGGLSLVARAARAAREFLGRVGGADGLVFVDTDDGAIAAEAIAWGAAVPFLRAAELAQDATPTIDSTLAALDRLEEGGRRFDAVVLLQPTSPLRTADDVLACWRRFDPVARPSVASVAATAHPVELALRREPDGRLFWAHWPGAELRRQDFAPAYWLTGAVYVNAPTTLRERRAFVVPGLTFGVELPTERSIDVDTATDLALAEATLGAAAPRRIEIAGRSIGGRPCFVIAEAGVNHNGDLTLARRLVDAAADAGADAVKFQTFDPELVVSREAPRAGYQIANTGSADSQLALLRQLALPREAFVALADHARERGILFLSTAFDEPSADFLDALGVPAFKVPSGEVTNHPFVAHLARKGKPLLVSTGMCTLAEVAEAVQVAREHGNPPLALFHCVTNYPASPAECNLRAMDTMRSAFGVPVGWSDHSEGVAISLAATVAGAEVLEKHFTLDRTLPGPDHLASLEPRELHQLVASIRAAEVAMGDGIKRPTASEGAHRLLVRRSLHASRDLRAGHALGVDDLVALRPAGGVAPAARAHILGRRLGRPLNRGEMLTEDHLV